MGTLVELAVQSRRIAPDRLRKRRRWLLLLSGRVYYRRHWAGNVGKALGAGEDVMRSNVLRWVHA